MMEQVICGGFLGSKMKQSNLSDFCSFSSSSSSSIGINSDDNDEDYNSKNIININDEEEVESKLKKTSFDSAVDALEQALPIRRGISNFYNGKSRSFTTLSNAKSSSIEDIAKPENPYSRKRKRLLAYSLLYNKGKPSLLKSPGIEVARNNCESRVDSESNNSRIPLLSHVATSPWRSFSVVDLQHCAASAGVFDTNLCSSLMRKRTKLNQVS